VTQPPESAVAAQLVVVVSGRRRMCLLHSLTACGLHRRIDTPSDRPTRVASCGRGIHASLAARVNNLAATCIFATAVCRHPGASRTRRILARECRLVQTPIFGIDVESISHLAARSGKHVGRGCSVSCTRHAVRAGLCACSHQGRAQIAVLKWLARHCFCRA